jgi:hypothetical protein
MVIVIAAQPDLAVDARVHVLETHHLFIEAARFFQMSHVEFHAPQLLVSDHCILP